MVTRLLLCDLKIAKYVNFLPIERKVSLKLKQSELMLHYFKPTSGYMYRYIYDVIMKHERHYALICEKLDQ